MTCIFHKWGKWRQYDKDVPTRYLFGCWGLDASVEHWQVKGCEKCGKVKHSYIGQTVKD